MNEGEIIYKEAFDNKVHRTDQQSLFMLANNDGWIFSVSMSLCPNCGVELLRQRKPASNTKQDNFGLFTTTIWWAVLDAVLTAAIIFMTRSAPQRTLSNLVAGLRFTLDFVFFQGYARGLRLSLVRVFGLADRKV